MTVSNEVYRHDYAGNDSTVLFAIGFYFLVDAHIKAVLYNSVTEVETELTLTTHYTLTGAGVPAGGELTMITAPTSDETLTILRDVDAKQETNYIEGASFPAEDHETALDKVTMIVQQLKEEVERAIRLSTSQHIDMELPTPIAEHFIRYNATADGLETLDLIDLSLYTVSDFVETLLDDLTAAAFLTTLGLDTDLLTLVLPADTTISDFIKTLLDDADAAAARITLGVQPRDNIMINQTFDIWQENTTFTNPANDVYTADGYYINKADGDGTAPSINVKKNTTDMEEGFAQCCELEITNVGVQGTTVRWYIQQNIEDYKKYSGRTVTLSTRLKASTTIALSRGQLALYDSIAAATTAIDSIGTTWTTYPITIDVDSAATSLQNILRLMLTGDGTISTTGSIYIQWMKLELGSFATPLIPRKTGDDLRLCQDFKTLIYEVNSTYTGKTMEVTVDDAAAVFGNALYCAADFHYERCDADAEATMPCRVLALEAGTGSKKVLLKGQICNTAWTWTAGPIYVSLTTGELTQSLVSFETGDQVQIVGWALSADTLYFRPDATIVEVP